MLKFTNRYIIYVITYYINNVSIHKSWHFWYITHENLKINLKLNINL